MLYIDPASVDLTQAVKDFSPASTPFRLTRQRDATGTYSPPGIWGDPTLATREKGRAVVESLVSGLLEDIEHVRTAPHSPGHAGASNRAAPALETSAAGNRRPAGPRGTVLRGRRELAYPHSPVSLVGRFLGEANAPGGVMAPEFYNQLGAMHGTIMIFLGAAARIPGRSKLPD